MKQNNMNKETMIASFVRIDHEKRCLTGAWLHAKDSTIGSEGAAGFRDTAGTLLPREDTGSAQRRRCACVLLLFTVILSFFHLAGADAEEGTYMKEWHFGFGRRQILFPEDSIQSLYIAGYHNGVRITGVLDWCEARAVWIDDGGEGVLIIGIDCIALDGGTVSLIREALSDVPGCQSVNVFATHTHAGPDTLGLWGPVLQNGKNEAYMQALIAAACEAAREAAVQVHPAALYFGQVKTENM